MSESSSGVAQRRVPRRYLRRIPWLASLPSENLDRVQQRSKQRHYAAGETILRRGVRGDLLGIVETGRIDVVFETPGGRTRTAAFHPGDHFTLHSALPGAATLRAATPVTLWTLDQAEIAALGQEPPPAPRPSPARRPGFWLLLTFSLVLVGATFLWAILTWPQGRTLLADLRYARGCWYLERGRATAASREFDAALNIDPAHADSHNALGYVHYREGRLEKALATFGRAARLAPDSDVVRNNLGLVYNHQGETDKALENMHRAADLSHNAAQIYVNLGNLYLAESDWLNAGRAYREALRIDPDLAATHHNLGVVYLRMRRWTEARGEFERALQLDPTLEVAHVGLGVLAFERRQFVRAQRAFQLAVELDPQDDVAYLYLGLVHKSLGHQEQAIRAFERALGLTSDPALREQAEQYLRELWAVP